MILLLLGVGGCRKAGTWLVKEDEVGNADAIVMLMGNLSDRALQVADLYMEGKASQVWVVEPYTNDYEALEERGVHLTTDTERAYRALTGLGIPTDRITALPGGSTSTRMEAEIVRDYLHTNSLQKKMHIETLLLVTSSWHTRRSYNLFKAAFRALEDPPVVCCSPSSYSVFHDDKWWKYREDIQDVVDEYLKMINFFLFEKRKLRKAEL